MFKFYLKLLFQLPQFLMKFSAPQPAIMKEQSENVSKMAKSVSKEFAGTGRSKYSSTSQSSGGSRPPSRGKSTTKSTSKSGPSKTVNMSGDVAQFVKDAIKRDQVVIFSKTYCPYCTMAKDVFKKMEKPFTVIELDKRDDGNNIQDILKEMTGERTVPRVFLNGECIGGGTDVQALYDSGQLQSMVIRKM